MHYIARHSESRVAKAAILSAVPPLMVKTPANPGGLPKSAFDDLQRPLAANRSQFYFDIVSGPFYWASSVCAYSRYCLQCNDECDRVRKHVGVKLSRDVEHGQAHGAFPVVLFQPVLMGRPRRLAAKPQGPRELPAAAPSPT